MGKPVILYQFDTAGTHVVTPTSGHQTDGYASSEIPGSGETNGFFMNWTAWLAYLQSGNMEGAWTFAGTVEFEVGVQFDSTAVFEAGVTFQQAVTFDLAATFDTTIHVVGVATVGGLSHTDAWEVPVNLVPAIATSSCAASGFTIVSSGSLWTYESMLIPGLRAGDTIVGVIITCVLGGSIGFELHAINGGSDSDAANFSASGTLTNHTITLGSPYTLVSGDAIYLKNPANGNNGDVLSQVVLLVTH